MTYALRAGVKKQGDRSHTRGARGRGPPGDGVRDLGGILVGCPGKSRESESRSSARLPLWLPPRWSYALTVQDRDATPDDELEASLARYTASAAEWARVQAESGPSIIAAVRDYLAALPVEGESLDRAQSTGPDDQGALVALGNLAERSRGLGELAQIQSLALLAAVVRWFSSESGRSEAEILDTLESPFREGEDETLAAIQQVEQSLHDSAHDKGE